MKSARNSRKTQTYRADVAETLTHLFAKRPELRSGKMFGFPAFYLRGKLFACVYGEGLGLKLPAEMVHDLQGKPGISPFRPYGMAKMKEWIQITRGHPENYAADAELFQASIAFVGRAAARSSDAATVGRSRKKPRSPGSPWGAGG